MGDQILEKDFNEMEETIEKLDSIIACKFVMNEEKYIEEIHIISNGKKSTKQISRDIQSILIARYDLDIDYKKISIAEIPDHGFKTIESRLEIEKISQENHGSLATINIGLSKNGLSMENTTEGVNTPKNVERIIAETTLKCVEDTCKDGTTFALEDVQAVQLSSRKVIIVIIMALLNGEAKPMSGSCIIRDNYTESIVKASLDAINRYISK